MNCRPPVTAKGPCVLRLWRELQLAASASADDRPDWTKSGDEVGRVLAQVQGQSHAFNYDLLFHVRPRKARIRPYLAAGLGAKDYVTTGPEPFPQPFPNVATITNQDQWRLLYSVGFGVKYEWGRYVVLRFDFRDYLTPFPKEVIAPAPHGTDRGIFEQFTPMFGVGYRF